ncbi:hypothetical protein CB1_000435016 [Camelus ferus]|nr:hypothetical protein CB1_000435016 [Camelus ferus]
MILFVLELEWVLSTGQDKQFAWHCSESGQRLGGYRTSAVASGLQYPLLDKILCERRPDKYEARMGAATIGSS